MLGSRSTRSTATDAQCCHSFLTFASLTTISGVTCTTRYRRSIRARREVELVHHQGRTVLLYTRAR